MDVKDNDVWCVLKQYMPSACVPVTPSVLLTLTRPTWKVNFAALAGGKAW